MTLLLLIAALELSYGTGAEVSKEWKEVSYRGRTRYALQSDSSRAWVHAESKGSHSALFHRLRRDVRGATLAWSWRVLRHPSGANTRTRSGDDRAAAVFVLVRRSWLPWRTRGLVYQWGTGEERGVWASSPYAQDVKVITLAGDAAGDAWRHEQRDLAADLEAAFGAAPERIEAIGVLCDADNTGDRAVADIGTLVLTWRDAAPDGAEAPPR
jgi:hypothetical protein